MKEFLQKNYVLVAGILSAVVLTLQQVMGSHPTDFKVIGMSLLLAVLGVLANQWKGAGVTVTGIIGNLAYTFISIYNTGTFTWAEFGTTALITVLLALSEGLKSYQPAADAKPLAEEAKAAVNKQ